MYTTKATYPRREFCKKQLFLYTLYCFIAILYLLEMPEQAVISRNSISLRWNLNFGRLYMNWILFFAAASFIVSVINTIYVMLSFYKKDKE